MIKLFQSDIQDPWYFGVNLANDALLIKTANKHDLPKEVDEAIRNLKKKPNHRYVLASAMGAGEAWGNNRNADYFPENDLLSKQQDDEPRVKERGFALPRFRTFEEGGFYHHHKNKPALGHPVYGHVPHAIWNPSMRTVLLIIGVDAAKDPETASWIDAGTPFEVSMGAKLPWDECTICHEKAKTRNEYCSCDSRYGHNGITPDGQRVGRINRKSYFFDISKVIKRAFEGGLSMLKVASDLSGSQMSIDLAKEYDLSDPTSYESKSDFDVTERLLKETEKFPSHLNEAVKKITADEHFISPVVLSSICQYSFPEIWGGFVEAGIIPSPSEFAYIFLFKNGREDLAMKFVGKQGLVGSGLRENDIDPTLFSYIRIEDRDVRVSEVAAKFTTEIMQNRSMRTIDDRLHSSLRKDSLSTNLESIDLEKILSTLYMILREKIAKHLTSFEKQASAGRMILGASAVAAPYIYSAHIQQKQAYGEPTNIIQNTIANNPGKLALGLGLGVAAPEATKDLLKRLTTSPKI